MPKVDKEAETKRAIEEKNKVASEQKNLIIIEDVEESSSSSSLSMYSIDFDRKKLRSAILLISHFDRSSNSW